MKVILIQSVPGLGQIDDVKEVSEGYGRNFLFAKNLAVPATEKSIKEIQSRRNKIAHHKEEELKHQQELADRLDSWEISLREKAGTAGALYAAIGPQKIVEALAKSGFKLDKNQIIMKPIKEAGEYTITVALRHGLEARVHVIVSTL
jgi:large subunit ribosomal protein L9